MSEISIVIEREVRPGIFILDREDDSEIVMQLDGSSMIKFSLSGGGEAGNINNFFENPNSLSSFYVGDKTFVQMVEESLPIASSVRLGGIKIGANLSIDAQGVLSAPAGGGGGAGVWGSITGTLTDQLDLMAFLNWFEVVNPGLANEYLRIKKPIAGDYEIQAWSDSGQLPATIWEALPPATTLVRGGIIVGANLTIDENGVLNAQAGGEGSANWGSIGGSLADQTDLSLALAGKISTSHAANSVTSGKISNWDDAYSWGDHAGLYKAAAYVPAWDDITSKPGTFPPSAHIHDTLTMANFTILQESGKLVVKYGSTVVFSISSAGYVKALDEIEAKITP